MTLSEASSEAESILVSEDMFSASIIAGKAYYLEIIQQYADGNWGDYQRFYFPSPGQKKLIFFPNLLKHKNIHHKLIVRAKGNIISYPLIIDLYQHI